MARYSGIIDSYDLSVQSPNILVNYNHLIVVQGSFGIGYLCFVPEAGMLGQNLKRPDEDLFDVYFWQKEYASVADMLRNESPVHFLYDTDKNICVLKTMKGVLAE
jgi:hypothetical protein